jgi:hypothetical protein
LDERKLAPERLKNLSTSVYSLLPLGKDGKPNIKIVYVFNVMVSLPGGEAKGRKLQLESVKQSLE